MKLITEEEFAPYVALVQELQDKVKDLTDKLSHRMKQPCQWWMQSQANTLFIGKKGKPLERHAFYKMVDNWIKQGDLVEGVNYMKSGSVRFISIEFLKGQLKGSKKQKLKRA